MGQLLALSTQGVRQSLCRLWQQGFRWAISSTSFCCESAGRVLGAVVTWLSLEGECEDLAEVGGRPAGMLDSSPKSPRQTIQVPDMERQEEFSLSC